MKKRLLLLVFVLFLSGCWDELPFKDVTVVSLLGIEGTVGEVKSIFAFPVFQDHQIKYAQSEGEGITFRDSRIDANRRSMEGLELSHLEVLLVSAESAKEDFYGLLDMLYRVPRNRLSSHIALVDGDLETYFKPPGKLEAEISNYYSDLLNTAKMNAYSPDYALQQACSILFEEAADLMLPYITLTENGVPKVDGVGLFSQNQFSGVVLRGKDSVIANLLRSKPGKYTRLAYMITMEEEELPIAIDIYKVKRKMNISDAKIDVSYKLNIIIEEFPHDQFYKKETTKKVEKLLAETITKDFNKVLQTMQQAKSDAVGFGMHVRAFHRKLWEKGDWQETFSTLPIHAKVEVTINRTGILE